METAGSTCIDYNCLPGPAAVALQLGTMAMEFAGVERVPRYSDGRRENDVEHSFMLGVVAVELAASLYPHLDRGLVSQYANVHDLIELETGDVPTFRLTDSQLQYKAAAEHAALPRLLEGLPPYTRRLVERYESQSDSESRYTKAADKLTALIVDIIGQGSRVVTEDFGITGLAGLQAGHRLLQERMLTKFGTEFPELCRIHADLCTVFEASFTA